MLFFKGCDRSDQVLKAIPGFASANPNEPVQFMMPGLYSFDFDFDSLVEIDDFINGQDYNRKLRKIKPGVRGIEGSDEVIINIPVTLKLVDKDMLADIIDQLDSYDTRTYILDVLHKNRKIYRLSEQELISLELNDEDDDDEDDEDGD